MGQALIYMSRGKVWDTDNKETSPNMGIKPLIRNLCDIQSANDSVAWGPLPKKQISIKGKESECGMGLGDDREWMLTHQQRG